ncbi:melatonin receptor type 1C-like [Diadema setosum]|uniref:melatonin receptor type 1C-like n=1 Tax=Diadema setosum TaxID=31175 RepID=UPI003B3AE63F
MYHTVIPSGFLELVKMNEVALSGENVTSVSFVYRSAVILSTFTVTTAVIGIVENLAIFLAFAMSRKLQTATNIFLINLSISQTVICFLWIFWAAMYLKDKKWLRSDATCQVLYALSPIATSCMSLTIMVIALNRYVLITKSKEMYSRVFSRRNVGCILVFCWFFPTVTLVIPQVSYHIVEYDMSIQSCNSDHPTKKALGLFRAIFVTITFLVTLCSYCKIFRHVRQSTRSLESSSSDSQARRQRNIEVKITKTMLSLISFYYILCVGPPMALGLTFAVLYKNDDKSIDIRALLIVVFVCAELLVLNSCVNPVIYGWKHPHFRLVLGCILRGRLREIPHPSGWLSRLLGRDHGATQVTYSLDAV